MIVEMVEIAYSAGLLQVKKQDIRNQRMSSSKYSKRGLKMNRNQKESNVEQLAGMAVSMVNSLAAGITLAILTAVAVAYLSIAQMGLEKINTLSLVMICTSVACLVFNFIIRLLSKYIEPMHPAILIMYGLNIVFSLISLGLTEDNPLTGEKVKTSYTLNEAKETMASVMDETIPLFIDCVLVIGAIIILTHTISSLFEIYNNMKRKRIIKK
ncbi:hypothetical protein GKR75_07975 [Providencia sp. wls1919]|nr:hypothetical protein [Providencia sp. wls1919]